MPEVQGLSTAAATSGLAADKRCPLKAQASVRFGSMGWEAFPQAQPNETEGFWDSLSDPRLASEVLLHFNSVLQEFRSEFGPTDRLYIRLNTFIDFENRVNELQPVLRKLVRKALAHRGHRKPWKEKQRAFHLAVVLEAANITPIPKSPPSPSTPHQETDRPGPLSADAAIAEMDAADAVLTPTPAVIIQTVQTKLKQLVGKTFGSLEANKRVAIRINGMLRKYNLRLACVQDKDGQKCGEPSLLRCNKLGNAANGAFYFEHATDNERHLRRTTIPALRVIPYSQPDRSPRTSRSQSSGS